MATDLREGVSTTIMRLLDTQGLDASIAFLSSVAGGDAENMLAMVTGWKSISEGGPPSAGILLEWGHTFVLADVHCTRVALMMFLPEIMACVAHDEWTLHSVLPMLHDWMHNVYPCDFLVDYVDVIANRLCVIADKPCAVQEVEMTICIFRRMAKCAHARDAVIESDSVTDAMLQVMLNEDVCMEAIVTMRTLHLVRTNAFARKGFDACMDLLREEHPWAWWDNDHQWVFELMALFSEYASASTIGACRVMDRVMPRIARRGFPECTWPVVLSMVTSPLVLPEETRRALCAVAHEGEWWDNIRHAVREVTKSCLVDGRECVDPVVASDGHTYDRAHLQRIFDEAAQANTVPRSPWTKKPLRRWMARNLCMID